MKKYKTVSSTLKDFEDWIKEREVLLFVFSNKKIIQISLEKNTDVKLFMELLTRIYNKNLYFNYFRNSNKRIILCVAKSKEDQQNIPKNDKSKRYDRYIGELFGFPKCCVEKYIEEEECRHPSLNSASRYIGQLKDRGLKDLFDICLVGTNVGCQGYGFIPCSPRCKHALKFKDRFDKILERIKK